VHTHTQLVTTLEPYAVLWSTVSTFYDHYASWVNGPFYKLVPEEVEGEASEAYR
jgi:dynein heavy chain